MALRCLVNPAAGRGLGARALPRLERLARAHDGEVVTTRDLAHLVAEARRARDEGLERLLVAGGDGTFHHALQELAGSPCALGLVPLGSGNDLAAVVGVPPELGAAFALAAAGRRRALDLGAVGGRRFAIYAGAGFDGEVARRNRRVRRLRGRAAYVYSVLREVAAFRPPRLRVEHESGAWEGEATMAVVANCPRFGGGLRIAPAADPADGWLDLVLVARVTRRELLRVFPRVYRGAHLGHPAVQALRSRWVRITSDRPLGVWGDGEPLVEDECGPWTFEVVPGGLAVIGP